MKKDVIELSAAFVNEAYKGRAELIEAAKDGFLGGWASANDQNAIETARLDAEKAEILDALRILFDEQNDAPLEKRRAQWEQAYQVAGVVLKKYGK